VVERAPALTGSTKCRRKKAARDRDGPCKAGNLDCINAQLIPGRLRPVHFI
jgi:hypothetical protein